MHFLLIFLSATEDSILWNYEFCMMCNSFNLECLGSSLDNLELSLNFIFVKVFVWFLQVWIVQSSTVSNVHLILYVHQGVGCLIISPTRELSMQTFGVLKELMAHHYHTYGLIMGGANRATEAQKLAKGETTLPLTFVVLGFIVEKTLGLRLNWLNIFELGILATVASLCK